ncbi:hypothetical protein Pint_05853 [Pistacia integerrima]|uniref:Uncharacterized protein n=1 Tax=Pistacia integerrima TaxID=434235 RepID=A0ACC0Z425_9ROSI|nr:hypothetical protein Pint_05853 [Pistacia integerrima]
MPERNVISWSALISGYAKCGKLLDARKVFDFLNSKNLVTWNTMLAGYAQHGLGRDALEIYSMMQRNKIKPNDVSFIAVLSACGHIGQTSRAYEFIKSFPIKPDKVVWRCLLSGCKTHKDVVLGRYAAEKILSIDPEDTSAHVMLSNVYAEAKMWDETAQVRKIMKEKALTKDTGYSWTELKNKIHYFSASHVAKFQGNDLREIMNGLTAQLFDAGYKPDAIFSFHCEE